MADSDKAAERTNLILHLGRLLAGLHSLAQQTPPPSSTEYQIAAAQFQSDLGAWQSEVLRFVVFGGINFGHEAREICREPQNLVPTLVGLARHARPDLVGKQAYLRGELSKCEQRTIAEIDSVPITWAPRLLAEKTPFTTFLSIRDAILTARKRVHYFDRYLDADFFPLYLRGLDRSVQVRLVTTAGKSNYGVRGVLAVSRLAAKAFSDFQLLECGPTDMHDRNLRVDDVIFFLGPSASAAGSCPTNFSPADSSASGHSVLDDILLKARVVA